MIELKSKNPNWRLYVATALPTLTASTFLQRTAKFENFTPNKNLNEALYKQAGKILNHRNGTAYEDIAMLDARTGKVLVENDSAAVKFRCGLTYSQYQLLQQQGKSFEIVHNHPNSTAPSTSDIIGLFERELATASTVIAHDGGVYRMEKLQPFPAIEKLIAQIYEEIRQRYIGYPEHLIENHATELAVERLIALKVLRYKVIK